MKHALIFAHPKAHSFTATIAHTYAKAVEALGDEVLVRDLYRMRFDPCLHAAELPHSGGFGPRDDVAAERALLADADVFVFVYPLWFNAPPAMIKGYVDRVFSMGFGYGPGPGGQIPLLEGRRLISFTSSGAPESWVRETGAFSALYTLFDQHVAAMCGLQILDHVHIGGIGPDVPIEAIEAAQDDVRKAVSRSFAPA